jgi:hypothetical protein
MTDDNLKGAFEVARGDERDERPMRYLDGREVRLGETVKLDSDAEGSVVCSIDTGEYSDGYPEAQWGYLGKGVMIDFPGTYGLIHFTEPDKDLALIARKPGSD